MNYWAIIVGVAINMALGMIWYSKALFGKTFMKALNVSEENAEDKSGMWKGMIASIVCALIMTWIMAIMISPGDARNGMYFAFLLWLGFVVTSQLVPAICQEPPAEAGGVFARRSISKRFLSTNKPLVYCAINPRGIY